MRWFAIGCADRQVNGYEPIFCLSIRHTPILQLFFPRQQRLHREMFCMKNLHAQLNFSKVAAKPVLFLIGVYQFIFSPHLSRNTCRFYPTCSEYTVEALKSYGLFRGSIVAGMRILRCNPLCRSGYDPIKQ